MVSIPFSANQARALPRSRTLNTVERCSGHAGTYDDELALLVVHGILHLLGMDHADDAGREAMQARERMLLSEHHGPLTSDPWAAIAAELGNDAPEATTEPGSQP